MYINSYMTKIENEKSRLNDLDVSNLPGFLEMERVKIFLHRLSELNW